MSIDALSWAFNLKLPGPATKLTLLALANYADEDGLAYPSQKTLSNRTCLSQRAVRNNLLILEKEGIVIITARKRPNGSTSSNLFKLLIGAGVDQRVAEKASAAPPARPAPPPAGDAPPPRTSCTRPPARPAPPESSYRTINGTVIEPKPEKPGDEGALPHGIRKETWDGFIEVRRKLGKNPTEKAIQLIFKALEKMQSEGEDVNAVLEQSIVNEWAGVFHTKHGRANVRSVYPEKFSPSGYVNRNVGKANALR